MSEELAKNLQLTDDPILFEVLHTCYLMGDPRFKKRFKIYRHSNIEHDYYAHLAKAEKNILRKLYLKIEAERLKKFEPVIANADLILAVNTSDLAYFRNNYPKVHSEYLPSFHPNDEISCKEGRGDYVLYHGNLSISENYIAASWLTEHVFSKLKLPVKIAGLNSPSFLKELIAAHKNIELIENPDEEKMRSLVADAGVHALYTAQGTGLKLKLLNVLYSGRFVICNSNMVEGTGFTNSHHLSICDTPEQFISAIDEKIELPFSKEDILERAACLKNFSNQINAGKLLSFLP